MGNTSTGRQLSLPLWRRILKSNGATLNEQIINVATDIDDKFNCDIPLTDEDELIYAEITELGIY